MADIKDMLRRLADLYEAEEKAELTKAQEERIAKLEKQLAGENNDDREEALEEITDDEFELIRRFFVRPDDAARPRGTAGAPPGGGNPLPCRPNARMQPHG
mgnify:CR=1 FL=1